MSLINQMLTDLEERGANNADAGANMASKLNASNLNTGNLDIGNISAVNTPNAHLLLANNAQLSFIKMGSMMLVLAGAAYLWTQNTQAESRAETSQKLSNLQPVPATAPVALPVLSQQVIEEKVTNDTPPKSASVESSNNAPINSLSPLFESELKFNVATLQLNAAKTKSSQVKSKEKNLAPTNLTAIAESKKDTLTQVSTATTKPEKPLQLALIEKPTSHANIESTPIAKQFRPDQKSINFYKQAISFLQQGRVAEAQASLANALEANPSNHEARQTLAGLLLDNKRNDDAKATLAAGVEIAPEQTDFRMALARLQIDAGDVNGALHSLTEGLSYAKDNAHFQIFLATLLQRASRHQEAIAHYHAALALNSASSTASANALVGLGISLQAIDKLAESQAAFTQALSSTALNPELLAFVEQRIKQIHQRVQN